jgi:hypothetical protein
MIRFRFALLILLTVGLLSCSSTQESPTYNKRHPSADLDRIFFPDQGMPSGETNNTEFFSKKCSVRSQKNHYSTSEYFCENR